MNGPATLAQLRQSVQASVRKVQKTFTNPRDDWESISLVQTPRGVEIFPIPNEWFRDAASKDLLGEALRRGMVLHGVFRYAFLMNAHAIAVEPEQLDEVMGPVAREEKRIEQMEGAYEQLTLTVGDPETEEIWVARIERDQRMIRTLGPWEDMLAYEGATFTGRFVGLNEYLRR